MADTLKFGPEWLRALSDGTNVTSPPPSPAAAGMPMYKLAEHRYGREEMLALCTMPQEVQSDLRELPCIVSERPLKPLAVVPLSDDEQRLMSQSVNSTLVLRLMGRGGGGPPVGLRGGRGAPDRGRGRGRGRGDGYYTRGFDDDPGYGRGRGSRDAWDEGPGARYERPFPPGRSFEDDITSPPRREFSRSMSTENWRETKKDEPTGEVDEGNDWRKAPNRWGSRGWREPRERFDTFEGRGRYDDYRDRPPYERGRNQRTHSGSWDEGGESDLPEWSTADVDDMESLGTFDSSGAFMSIKGERPGERYYADGQEPKVIGNSRSSSKEKDSESSRSSSEPTNIEKKDDEPVVVANEKPQKDPSSKPKESVDKMPKDSRDNSQKAESTRQTAIDKKERVVLPQKVQPNSEQKPAKKQSQDKVKLVPDNTKDVPFQTSKDTKHESKPNPQLPKVAANKMDNRKSEDEANFDHLEQAAENLVATLGAEEDKEVSALGVASESSQVLSQDHEDAMKWFYRDPQGDLQGPFTSSEMAEWFSAGYFTMNLLVKRGCDEKFQPLGELIKSWGRVPFSPGTSQPPLKNSPEAVVASTQSTTPEVATTVPLSAAAITGLPPILAGMATAGLPNTAENSEQMKVLQQQMLLQQQVMQQQLLRQMQLQQVMTQLQAQPEFASLPLAQQQQHAVKVLLQQQMLLMQQQQSQVPPQPVVSQAQQPQQKLSPRSLAKAEAIQRSISQQPGQTNAPGFHRSLSHPGQEEIGESIWGLGAPTAPTSTAPPAVQSWTPPSSVWDMDPTKVQSLEDLQRREAERSKKDEHQVNLRKQDEERRKEEERRKKELEQQEHIEREKQEHLRLEMMERQREMERRQDLERQRLELLAREQDDMRRRQEEEEQRRLQQMEEQKRLEEHRRQEEEKRRKEQERRAEEQRQMEEQRRLEAQRQEEQRRIDEQRRSEEQRLLEEQQRQEQEELRKKEFEEKKRQDEIKRRQEKFEELRRQQQAQQQEALRRMNQEQLGNIQLPATAQWGSSSASPVSSGGGSTPTGALSLTQIQQLETERDRKDQEERKIELQRQQLNALQLQREQQQLQGRSWASAAAPSQVPVGIHTPSLLEIQQEQARQQHDVKPTQPSKPAPVPLATAAVWGGSAASQSSNWAQEGAWGNPKTKATLGFWDEAVTAAPPPPPPQRNEPTQKKGLLNNNSHFPSLGSSQTANGSRPAVTKTKSKSNKDEETVQRLFQNMKPKDEFTQWCENALKGIQSNVDIPTFVAFLTEVESPYEVHDYARSYLGETRETTEFTRQFLEKRSKYKNQLRQQKHPEDNIWGPAPAVNPNQARSQANNNQNNSAEGDESRSNKKKKKGTRMQKVDHSFLGFTVHAAPDRINIGAIENAKVE